MKLQIAFGMNKNNDPVQATLTTDGSSQAPIEVIKILSEKVPSMITNIQRDDKNQIIHLVLNAKSDEQIKLMNNIMMKVINCVPETELNKIQYIPSIN